MISGSGNHDFRTWDVRLEIMLSGNKIMLSEAGGDAGNHDFWIWKS